MNKRLYTAKLKLKVTPEAEETNNLVVVYLFDINEQQVWVEEKLDLSKHALGKKVNGSKNAVSNFGRGTYYLSVR